MKLAGVYSHKGGAEEIASVFPDLLAEIKGVIRSVDISTSRAGRIRGKTQRRRASSRPRAVCRAIRAALRQAAGWRLVRIERAPAAVGPRRVRTRHSGGIGFRDLGFAKRRLGVHAQFLKPAPAVCSVCAHMTIFHKLGYIDCGIEIVPVKSFADQMSTGVSCFEQFVWDLEHRGVSDIDVPVLVLGVDA